MEVRRQVCKAEARQVAQSPRGGASRRVRSARQREVSWRVAPTVQEAVQPRAATGPRAAHPVSGVLRKRAKLILERVARKTVRVAGCQPVGKRQPVAQSRAPPCRPAVLARGAQLREAPPREAAGPGGRHRPRAVARQARVRWVAARRVGPAERRAPGAAKHQRSRAVQRQSKAAGKVAST